MSGKAMAHNIHGAYTRLDGRAYNYYGKCESEFPLQWEVHVWRSTDKPHDCPQGFSP